MRLADDITEISGVGTAVASKLHRLKIYTVGDIIYNFPRTYNDFSQVTAVDSLRPGIVTISCVIQKISGHYVRRGMHITEAVATDNTGSVRIVWFNQPFRTKSITQNTIYMLSGEFGLHGRHLSIVNPVIEQEKEVQLHTGRIVPVYRQTKGITSARIRTIVKACQGEISSINECLPPKIIEKNKLLSFAEAVQLIHFPDSDQSLQKARHRLGFQEVFDLAFAAALNKQQNAKQESVKIAFRPQAAKKFVASLPFNLTDAQRKAAWQILSDMNSHTPMNRMVEGDVGSGKTVVAAMATYIALENGLQTAIMAPTEVLARQLANTMNALLKRQQKNEQVALLLGSFKAQQKKEIKDEVATKKKHVIVGTHALIQDTVDMHSLGLVIIDEQHRFGVSQREALLKKAGHMPHVLTMTATPIPRSLALTLYGELDISIIDEKPKGRVPVATTLESPNSRANFVAPTLARLKKGEQVFIVCPLIEDSDDLPALSAESVYKKAVTTYKGFKVGLLHGRMKPDEKESIMQNFVDGGLNVLVSTTVIEVGVDVPNATTMIIESAERFGLAQLHQLRGRVGRSSMPSYCYLVMSDSKQPPKRLRFMEQINDGFLLAEKDLELRGPGAIYGHSQHGQLDLRVAKLSDVKLIASARSAANYCATEGSKLVQYEQLVERSMKYRAITNLN